MKTGGYSVTHLISSYGPCLERNVSVRDRSKSSWLQFMILEWCSNSKRFCWLAENPCFSLKCLG